MKYLLAPDSFKEAASAQAVAESMRRGVAAGDPGAECRMMPLSDGGEGLTDALVQATSGELRSEHAHDALGRPIITRYGFLGEGGFGTSHDGENPRTAVVELAAASGIERISPADRDPLAASTFGTGELIRAAIDAGAERIVLGLGGSATTDGGTGLARALGHRFLDADDCELPLGGGALPRLARIDDTEVPDDVRNIPIVLACDVTNPLTGTDGAAAVFAPQKGANPEQAALLDCGLGRLADAITALNGRKITDKPGAGAAGGTVLHSRRVGAEEALSQWGFSLQEEKEAVMILTRAESKLAIMQAICDSCGLQSEAQGIVLSLPVDRVVGLE